MKFLSIMFLILFAFACEKDVPPTNVCKDVVCNTNFECNTDGNCVCKEGYKLEGENCVLDASSCNPNPCKEDNKSICNIENSVVTCSCDDNYSDYDGICCQANSKNVDGKCECIDGFKLDNGKCVDICEPNPCKESNKTVCQKIDDQFICTCDTGFHDDDGVCCSSNAENNSGTCECKTGYTMVNDKCILDLCIDPNPCKDDNRTICSMDEKGRIVCSCNDEFHLSNGECVTNEGDPCHPNPCTDEASHKTRCLWDPQDNTKFICHCSVEDGYHDDNGVCCQALSHNDGGECICNDNYGMDSETGKCVILCTEDSVEGFNGLCLNSNEICVQGICTDNQCIDFSCPENSECATQNDTPECYCNSGYHMSNNVCCKANASNVGGNCVCDAGYTLTAGVCTPDANNPCETNPSPCTESHKNSCLVDDSVNGYHCDCNVGFSLDNVDNRCKLTTVETCPNDLICLNSYCVEPGDRQNEQCLTDDDCHAFNSEATSTCNPDVVGGVCVNCQTSSDCPANTYCEETYHTCKNECDSDSDCPSGRCSTRLSMCLIATCNSDEDCQLGSVCIKDNEDSSGMCKRIPCQETACSQFNQNGTCEDGKTCIYGSCIDSCAPNPCTNEPFKTVCSSDAGVISCACENGYHENESGTCVPNTTNNCPTGFTCESGYCTDRADSGFVCANDTDCGDHSTCSSPMTLPAGKCTGCTLKADCPHVGDYNIFECIAGYCLATCSAQSDCNAGMICAPAGSLGMVCKSKNCTNVNDCPTGYVCDGESLKCERTPCQ